MSEIISTQDGPCQRRSHYPIKARVAGCLGHAIEWFDFSIYANFAIFFGPQIFPRGDQRSALLAAFGVYAIGFIMRPAGGWLLGIIADRHGRRTALTISVTMMAIGSFALAVIPPYAAIGIAAPIIATIARLLQGLSVGGEFAAACAFLAETAPPNRRGFQGSFLFVGCGLGLIAASGVVWLLANFMTHEQMVLFGWRIPFMIGAVSGIFAYWLRTRVEETESFNRLSKNKKSAKTTLRVLFTRYRRATWIMIGANVIGAFAFYLLIVYLPVYAIRVFGAKPAIAYAASTVSLVIFTLIQPVLGILSDKLGRRPQLIVMAAAYTVLLYPAMTSVGSGFWSMAKVEIVGVILFALFTSITPAVLSELFDTEFRSLGIGVTFNLVMAVLGGTTPFLMTWLQDHHDERFFFVYASIGSAISLITFILMPETLTRELDESHFQ